MDKRETEIEKKADIIAGGIIAVLLLTLFFSGIGLLSSGNNLEGVLAIGIAFIGCIFTSKREPICSREACRGPKEERPIKPIKISDISDSAEEAEEERTLEDLVARVEARQVAVEEDS